ncbi:hypothetical protein K1T73_07395 [Roseovarius sp. SCSIO 43702]|uniref:hypothetical protein n=1 Tax=Roseovarius sp. SCSIO 43702 TaxID=2823043 RepID=UPI001C72C525|nr:hypothetical protein [Roseovarius sp. SCSIO 43702]QYX58180.1 hypothetical protein K1T73_07395 [Roseovarius sp. SCSIO 43702]
MSAPDTNVKKQEKRHKGPLAGMLAVVIFAGVLLIALGAYIVYQGNEPRDAEEADIPAPVVDELSDTDGG